MARIFGKLTLISTALVLICAWQSVDAQEKRVACYFGSWAKYRPGAGKFDVENIDPHICTHLYYSFAGLSNDGRMIALDSYNDEEGDWQLGAWRRFTNLKNQNPKVKTLLAIGGWNEGSEKYSRMAATAQSRRAFIDSVIPILTQYNFDGLDLDWEYPAACTINCGKPEDKANFALLCRELRADFNSRGWLLTAAVSAGQFVIADAYDIPSISNSLDFINVMTYDFHGGWEKHTGHHSPLGAHPGEVGNNTILNSIHAIEYWISEGANPSKLNLGLGSYGRGFILDNPNDNGFYAPASNPIPAGPYTREAGFWGYNEIVERFRQEQWTIQTDIYYRAPHAFRNTLWIGYDDPESIRVKSIWAMQRGLGGVFLWSVETDDFHGLNGERNPLMKTMYRTVNGDIPDPPPTTTTTSTTRDPNLPTTTTTTTEKPPPEPGLCTENGQHLAEKCDKYFIVCNWNGNEWEHHRYNCSVGLSYDPSIKNCNWNDVIGCS